MFKSGREKDKEREKEKDKVEKLAKLAKLDQLEKKKESGCSASALSLCYPTLLAFLCSCTRSDSCIHTSIS